MQNAPPAASQHCQSAGCTTRAADNTALGLLPSPQPQALLTHQPWLRLDTELGGVVHKEGGVCSVSFVLASPRHPGPPRSPPAAAPRASLPLPGCSCSPDSRGAHTAQKPPADALPHQADASPAWLLAACAFAQRQQRRASGNLDSGHPLTGWTGTWRRESPSSTSWLQGRDRAVTSDMEGPGAGRPPPLVLAAPGTPWPLGGSPSLSHSALICGGRGHSHPCA